MTERELVDRVRGMIDPILLNEGMELVDVEYRRESRGWVLRLILDKEGGITLDDCTQVSQEAGRSLDVEDDYTNSVHVRGFLARSYPFLENRKRLYQISRSFDQSEDRRSD